MAAKTKTFGAPSGGWNTRDSLSDMDPKDAVVLKNWWPGGTADVRVRKGFTPWSADLPGYIETLMSYSGGATDVLFAASSSGTIYNIAGQDIFLTDEEGNYIYTEDGANLVTDSTSSLTSETGLSNGRLQYVNFTTTGGSYIRFVNGVDYSGVYDGTNWYSDGDGAPYDITGVDSRTLIHINMHKSRLWFIQSDTLKAFYLPVLQVGGAVASFDLSSIAQRGGYLMAMSTWTIDGGYGVDDMAVFITSMGEVIVYRGTDPASASTWALVGNWHIGAPIGRRCLYKWAGDLLVINQDGVQAMSAALLSSRTAPTTDVTNKIDPTITESIGNSGSYYGWQLLYNPNANMLILNVPVRERVGQEQYVMNSISKSWARFTGWNANCWEMYKNKAYFGGDGFVGVAWDSNSDAGEDINASAIQAFSYLGRPGAQKRMTMFQPIFYTDGSPPVSGGINVDFDTNSSVGAIEILPSLYATWDTGVWDTGLWAPDLDMRKNWNGARGVGNAFAPAFDATVNGIELQWVNTTLVYEEGGIL